VSRMRIPHGHHMAAQLHKQHRLQPGQVGLASTLGGRMLQAASSGRWCRRYPTDLTDVQWALLAPLIPAPKARWAARTGLWLAAYLCSAWRTDPSNEAVTLPT